MTTTKDIIAQYQIIETIEKASEEFKEDTDVLENAELDNLVDKAQRLGFANLKHGKDNCDYCNLVDVKKFLNRRYKKYKFVTDGVLKKLLKDYNLYLTDPENYIGTIPEENLIELNNFKKPNYSFGKGDIFYMRLVIGKREKVSARLFSFPKYIHKYNIFDYKIISNEVKRNMGLNYGLGESHNTDNTEVYKIWKDFLIVAPKNKINKDVCFTKDGVSIKEIETVELLDPIILFPLEYGFIIVTAWDKEARIVENILI